MIFPKKVSFSENHDYGEDYLSKIFTLAEPHPVLPLELRAFEDSEVEAGLELFELSQYWQL